MKSLVRGGVILSIMSLFVIFIYAQVQTESALNIANDSQTQFNTTLIDQNLALQTNINQTNSNKKQNDSNKIEKTVSVKSTANAEAEAGQDQDQYKSKVEKTVLSRAVSKAAGISKGSFVATAYCLRGKTAMGHGVRAGLIAADPRVIKLGSKIALNAGQYSGAYLVSDTGGGIKGRRLDIWMASCAEAKRFGRRTVSVGLLQ